MKTVSLVLGSGGARGLAHIGVIRWLEECGYEITSIAGCSIGSVIGGVYAIGKLDEFEKWICAVTKIEIFSLLDVSLAKGGFVKGDKIINVLRELVGEKNIEDLPISYTAVAADIQREKEVWLTKGPLFDAIRASISLPMFFTPFDYNGVKLIDGGVLNPVPIAPTFTDNTDITIAVNLGGPPIQNLERFSDKKNDESNSSFFHKKINSFIDKLTPDNSDLLSGDWGMYDVANQSFDAMQSTIARHKLAAYPPDIVVELARNACGTMEFDRSREMIDLGYEMAKGAIPTLE